MKINKRVVRETVPCLGDKKRCGHGHGSEMDETMERQERNQSDCL